MSGMALHLRILWHRNSGLIGLYVLLAALLGVYVYLYPGLLSVAGVARFTQNWFPIAVVALAQTLIMLMGGIDLAIGATVSLGCVLAASYIGDSYGGAAIGIAIAVAVGAAIGGVIGAIVALIRIPAIVVTLAASFIIGGVALLVMPRPGGHIPVWLSDGLAGELPTALFLLILLADRLASPAGDAARPGHQCGGQQPGRRLSQRRQRRPCPYRGLCHLGRALRLRRGLYRGPDGLRRPDHRHALDPRIRSPPRCWAGSAFSAASARFAVPSPAACCSP